MKERVSAVNEIIEYKKWGVQLPHDGSLYYTMLSEWEERR
jgi:hypothetical protein